MLHNDGTKRRRHFTLKLHFIITTPNIPINEIDLYVKMMMGYRLKGKSGRNVAFAPPSLVRSKVSSYIQGRRSFEAVYTVQVTLQDMSVHLMVHNLFPILPKHGFIFDWNIRLVSMNVTLEEEKSEKDMGVSSKA